LSARTLALTKYAYAGPSSRYRYYNYVACLHERDIEMAVSPLFHDDYFEVGGKTAKIIYALKAYMARLWIVLALLFTSRKYDLLIIEYELFPFFPAVFERLLAVRGRNYIVDYDDAIFHKYDLHANALVRRLLGGKIGQVMKMAETVIVCNAYLEQYAQKHNGNIVRLPTVVLLDKYKEAEKKHIRQPDKPFTIGWIGSKSTSIYLLDILPAIEKFAASRDVRFNFVGFDESVLPAGAKERCKINAIGWSEETEVDEILDFDVGIMPLRSDPWSQGKCGFKLVQYMSCKKPVIASPVGMNVALVEAGVNGCIAGTADEWFDAFEKLYKDKHLRFRMAEANYVKVLDQYNHQKNCDRYIGLIREITGK